MKAAPRAEAEPDLILAGIDRVAGESPDTASTLADYRAAVLKAAGELPDQEYMALPHTLIHGDIQPANILVRDGAVVGMVDLDWCCWQARLYDLCNAILFCCAGHAEPVDGSDIASITQAPMLDPAVVAGFLHSYHRAAGDLTPEERAALVPLCMLTWCHTRVNGALKSPGAARRAFLERPPDVSTSEWLNLPVID
jgi:Ser/Thr protein kinase RdoA (MazF antagonist)